MTTNILEKSYALQTDIVNQRRYLHANPELSFAEFNTGAYLKQELAKLGYIINYPIAKTGLTADLTTNPKIAIRADMDALPIQENNNCIYQSKVKNIMHACGHDAHMSIALACAKLLTEDQNLPVRIIMQPAEENSDEAGKSGAYRMIEAGALNGIQAIIGLHVDANIKPGQIAIASGPVMAASDSFKLKIIGAGGHGAFPESTIDAVVLSAYLITQFQQIISRKISAFEPAILTIGAIHSSSIAGNVISDFVELKGTIRSFSKQIRQTLIQELDNICQTTKNLGGNYEIQFESGYPATVNHPGIAQIMKTTAIKLIGAQNVIESTPKLWSEDFSLYQELIPGAFMFLGAKIEDSPRKHHHPNFDLDESGLYLGTAIMAQTVMELNKGFIK